MGKKKIKTKTNYATKINKNDPLNWWNKFWVGLTLTTILVEFVGLIFFEQTFRPKSIFILSLGIPSILMMFQYRQLRKSKVFLIWLIICLLLFGVFLFVKIASISLTDEYSYGFRGLKTPIVFLTAFYFFRKISNSVWKTELIIPPRYSRFDDEEGRKTNLMDYIAFFSYWPILILTFMY